MSELLFSVPWIYIAGAVIVGIVVFLQGNRTQKTPLRNAGLGLVLLAILWALVSHFVETSTERVIRQTHELVAATVKRDWKAFGDLLDEHCTFAGYGNKQKLVDGAQRSVEFVNLKSASVRSADATADQEGINVRIDVLSAQDPTQDRPFPSSWMMRWHDRNGAWLLYQIETLQTQNVGPREIERYLK